MHHVSYDELGEGNLAHAGLRALDAAGDLDHIEKPLHGGVAVPFLEEAEEPGDEHHREDDDGGRGVLVAWGRQDDVRHEGDDREHDEDTRERVGERLREPLRHRCLLDMVDRIRTVALPCVLDLLGGQAGAVGAELCVCLAGGTGSQRAHSFPRLASCLRVGVRLSRLVSH